MIKEAVKIAFLLAAGVMVYDIKKSGGFTNTNLYRFLEETGVADFGEACLTHLKAFFYVMFKLFTIDEKNEFQYLVSCETVRAYRDMFYNLILVWKNSILSVFENSSQSFNKAFPTAVNDVSMLVSGALTSTKEGLVMISSCVENLTLSAVNYANEMLSRT